MHELRLAARRLIKKPGFTLLAILTLAIGLGASAAVFSIVDAVLIRPLPYVEANRLVAIEHSAPGLDLEELGMSRRLYVHYREHTTAFADIGMYDDGPAAISGLEPPIEVPGATITPSVLRILRAQPARGRIFIDEEGAPGATDAVIVSERFWRRHLGADPGVLEQSLAVDGTIRRIVGVMPASFEFPLPEIDVWVPDVADPTRERLGVFGSLGIARLADGIAPQQAASDLMRFAGDLRGIFPDDSASKVLAEARFAAQVRPLRDAVVGDIGPLLWVLLATVGFVLLLAAINVASLFLARAVDRRHEIAIRQALGAERGALLGTAIVEGFLVSSLAAAVGLGAGHIGLRLLSGLAPARLPRLNEAAIDLRTMAVVCGLALICGFVFALIPNLGLGGRALSRTLRRGGRSISGSAQRMRARRALVAVQMAIAIVLLVGSGLMARSYQRLIAVDPGFVPTSAISFRLSLPAAGTPRDVDAAAFYDQLLGRLAALPGVASAASATAIPLSRQGLESGHRIEDEVNRGEGKMPTLFAMRQISPGYFAALGVPILEGRPLERGDFEQRTGAVVVSQALARRHWPGESAIGKRLFPGRPENDGDWYEVVGITGDVHESDLAETPMPAVYYPWLAKQPDLLVARNQTVVLRMAESAPWPTLETLRAEIGALDETLPVSEILTLDQLVRRARARSAFTASMLVLAAAVAVALGAVGTYGVISDLVNRRRHEIGVRMAIGARRRRIIAMVVREGLLLAFTGGAAGLVAALGLSRFLESVLYAVDPREPLIFFSVPVVLLVVATLASALPASRAAAIEPAIALRHD